MFTAPSRDIAGRSTCRSLDHDFEQPGSSVGARQGVIFGRDSAKRMLLNRKGVTKGI
jgi:hypothetical protein